MNFIENIVMESITISILKKYQFIFFSKAAKSIHFLPVLILLTFSGCSGKNDEYGIERYFDQEARDTLLVNMVTYIGKKPRLADFETRHNQEHRIFYTLQARDFRFQYYYISDDSVHYYYLIRPARSTAGDLRGVGGRFRVRHDLSLFEFEETFNTPVLPEESLVVRGKSLFIEMINTGNVDRYLKNKNYVEWPDDRLKYDRSKNEWRYDVIQ